MSLISLPLLYWLLFDKPRARWVLPVSCGLGVVAAISVLGYMIRGQFGAFAQFVFRQMPKYWDLSDAYVFKISFLPYLRITLLYAAVTLWVAAILIREVYRAGGMWRGAKLFLDQYFMEFLLLLIALMFFRSALGRSDWEHLVYVSLPMYLLLFILVGKRVILPSISVRCGA